MNKPPKLTLKSTLSPSTQAKISSLMADSLQQTDRQLIRSGLSDQEKLQQLFSSLKGRDHDQSRSLRAKQTKPASSPASGAKADSPSTKDDARLTVHKPARQAAQALIQAAQRWLIETYPAVFNSDHPKPLKCRISAELFPQRPPHISYNQLKRALRGWTMRQAYLQSVMDHEQRYDLTGQPVENILPEHKGHARSQLELKKKMSEERQQRCEPYKERRKLSHKSPYKPGDNVNIDPSSLDSGS